MINTLDVFNLALMCVVYFTRVVNIIGLNITSATPNRIHYVNGKTKKNGTKLRDELVNEYITEKMIKGVNFITRLSDN